MTILCVDDEQLVLDHTLSLCRELPQKLEAVGFLSAEEALVWLENHKPDLALLDLNLPKMDGLLLASKLKEHDPDTRVIFMTGYSRFVAQSSQVHVPGYLLKPVGSSQLEEAIDSTLSHASQENLPCAHLYFRTFGSFDLLKDGVPVSFPSVQSKELLALLIHCLGGSISYAEAFRFLFHTANYSGLLQHIQLRKVIHSLRAVLKSCGAGKALEAPGNTLRIRPSDLSCDLFRFVEGDVAAVNCYRGIYMAPYPWAHFAEAYEYRRTGMVRSPLRASL